MAIDELLQAGIRAANAGDQQTAGEIFMKVVQQDPDSEQGWLWLGWCRQDPQQKIYCFRRVLAINPNNDAAMRQLVSLGQAPVANPPQALVAASSPAVAGPAPLQAGASAAGQLKSPLSAAAEPEQKEEETPVNATPEEQVTTRRENTKTFAILAGAIGLLAICCLGVGYLILSSGTFTTTVKPGPALTLAPVTEVVAAQATTPAATEAPRTAAAAVTEVVTDVTGQNPAYMPVFSPGPCPFIAPKKSKVDCGNVVVPEDRPGTPIHTIRLAVAVYRSTNPEPAEPVIYLQGGPGSAAVIWSTSVYTSVIAPILAERDFIVFDPRGTGVSAPKLNCDELRRVYVQDLIQPFPGDGRDPAYLEALTACRDRLKRQGINLEAYTSPAMAADVVDILTALKVERANLYGTSYGTRVAQLVIRDNPERVRSAILDSVVPIEAQLLNDSPAAGQASLEALFQGCAAQPACQSAYPKLKETYQAVVQQLDEKAATVEVPLPSGGPNYRAKVNGAAFRNAILWMLQRSEFVPFIPKLIDEAGNHKYGLLSSALTLPPEVLGGLAIGDYLSVVCRDQVFATSPQALADSLASYPPDGPLSLSWVYGSPMAAFQACSQWGAQLPAAGELAPLASDIPTLLISGRYDPLTPPQYAQQVAERLPHSFWVEIAASHCPSLSASSCLENLLVSFLNNPATEPDRLCLDTAAPLNFSLP